MNIYENLYQVCTRWLWYNDKILTGSVIVFEFYLSRTLNKICLSHFPYFVYHTNTYLQYVVIFKMSSYSSNYLTFRAILYLYRSQIWPNMEYCRRFQRGLTSPHFPGTIEFKSVFTSLWDTNYFTLSNSSHTNGLVQTSHHSLLLPVQTSSEIPPYCSRPASFPPYSAGEKF